MDKISQFLEDVEYLPAYLRLLKEIVKSGNCNDCAKRQTCKYAPGWGELVRYNCPHYEAKPKTEPDHTLHVRFVNRVKTNIGCPECGKPLYRRTDIILACNPPADKYECDSCGWSGNVMRYV